jgi:hypothetical protein
MEISNKNTCPRGGLLSRGIIKILLGPDRKYCLDFGADDLDLKIEKKLGNGEGMGSK